MWGLFLQARIIRSSNIFALRGIRICKNSAHIHYMSKQINTNVHVVLPGIQEFELSDFELSSIDCIFLYCE